jgi:redox-sensitive bicupin YhaK (pirin superfamily)
MMKTVRRATERGHGQHGWLDTRHTFSFADYRDPDHMGFRALRVINEDRVAPGQGFGAHPHRDMEILSYVLEGKLEHRDSMGNGAVLGPGELQRITAGRGMQHSEFNPDAARPVHFYQIWLLPAERGLTPSWEQKAIAAKEGAWTLAASPDAADGSLKIHQDARVLLGRLAARQELRYELAPGRHAWLQVVRGNVEVDGQALSAGDGLAVSEEETLALRGVGEAEVILFDLL